jgi:hypothetical protein
MVPSRRRGVVLASAAVLVTALVLSSCGGSAGPAASPADPTTSTSSSARPSSTGTTAGSTPGTEPTPDAQVFAAYLSALKAFDDALSDPPNPSDPLLAQTMVDPMLAQTVKLAGEWRGTGQASKYPPDSVHRITLISGSVSGNQATIESCNVDDGIVYEPASGQVVNDKVTTVHDRATLMLVDGAWKLATREQVEKWEGVAGCALATS